MVYLPQDIINTIISFVERPQTNKIIKYVIKECYEEDYDPYYAETLYDNYCFEYSFKEWYFLYRKLWVTNLYKHNSYKHTPYPLYIGSYKYKL